MHFLTIYYGASIQTSERTVLKRYLNVGVRCTSKCIDYAAETAYPLLTGGDAAK